MIKLEQNNWYDLWVDLHTQYAFRPNAVIDRRFATRAISFDNELTLTSNDLGDLTIETVGYTPYKLSLFDRRYIIPGEMERITETLVQRRIAGRDLSIISLPFKLDDGAHTQGPCLTNMIITMVKSGSDWRIEFDTYLRIGEITRRMAVDFIKIQGIIEYMLKALEQYDVKLKTIKVKSKAFYAEPMSLTLVHYQLGLDFNLNHWLHKAVQQKLEVFNSDREIKFKRGNRIRNHMRRFKEKSNGGS